MQQKIKWVGAALMVGGLLMLTRMAPIFVVLPDDLSFPPESTQEMVRLAAIAGSRWQFSHVMGLVAVALFIIAYGWHAKLLIQLGWKRVGLAIAAIAMVAFGLLGVALTIDGFFVPLTIQQHVSPGAGESMTLEHVAESHALALSIFTPAVFLMFVAVGLLSTPMLHRSIHSRWMGLVGQLVAVLAVVAYVTGAAGPHWDNLKIAGSLMMAAFAWHLVVGSRALFVKPGIGVT
jgi:hypothetical protein